MAPMRFEEALKKYHDEIYRYLYRLCLSARAESPWEEAADLTQDTFERAFQAYERLKPGSNVRAWLYAIAVNRARDRHARRQRDPTLRAESHTVVAGDDGPELALIKSQQQQSLLAALEQLPFKQKQAVMLRYLQELDYEEIGQVLSCSTDSARGNVYQALKKLRAAGEAVEGRS